MVPSFEFACCWELGNDHNKVSSAEMIYTACFTKIVERSKIGLCLGGGLVEAKGVGKRTIIL
jgi:hypothetical protein